MKNVSSISNIRQKSLRSPHEGTDGRTRSSISQSGRGCGTSDMGKEANESTPPWTHLAPATDLGIVHDGKASGNDSDNSP
eukprot:scaffold60330_cov28-Tisochrysis_lutea.AAC.1